MTLEDRVAILEKAVVELSEMRKDISDIKEIVEAWTNWKGFARVMLVVGKIFKWCAGIGVTLGTLWLMFKGQK